MVYPWPQTPQITDDVIDIDPESSHPSTLKIHTSNRVSVDSMDGLSDINEDSFEIKPDIESCSKSSTQNPTLNRHKFKRRDSILSELVSTGEDEKESSKFSLSTNARFYIFFLVLPTMVSLLFSIAILFPYDARQRYPLFLWTDGALEISEEGKWTLCPRDSVCSEGAVQILLIVTSRLTAFASYAVMGMVFLSKMHCSIHWLSSTLASTIIPLENLHNVHHKTGTIYIVLILLHTIAHFVRWSIRQEIVKRINTQVGISGLIGIFSMIVVVSSMTSLGKKAIATFESRLNLHYLFLGLAGALFLHTARCRYMTMVFFGLWSLDFLYGYFFKTYRLDVVEFSPLPYEAGVQMLWHNPSGFKVKSGEYVKIKLPWLREGGNEWHPFSIYLHEATEQGLRNVLQIKAEERNIEQALLGDDVVGGRELHPKKTALLLIEFQNEFASPGGKLHDGVKSEMFRTDMINKTAMLAEVARATGAYIFHIPHIIDCEKSDHPNKDLGILKDCRERNLFAKGAWNSEFIDDHKPRNCDIVVRGKSGLDAFVGSNLGELLQDRGIETVIVGGFLTNCCVESTVRSAFEKGYNVIGLTDGSACNSMHQHLAATEGTFKMFGTPLTCEQATMALLGQISTKRDRFLLSTNLSNPSRPTLSLEEFITLVLTRETKDYKPSGPALIMKEARKDMYAQYETTQVFIAPVGDWTKRVAKVITDKSQMRSCWVRGPYTSPYSIASNFNNMVLVASGIGITPALGVMGQYSGSSRLKFLIWTTRCPYMLKFFAPLLKDALIATVFYTGKNYVFTEKELIALRSYGNIYIKQGRPSDLTKVIESLIVTYENQACEFMKDRNIGHRRLSRTGKTNQVTVDSMDEEELRAWCVLYCGGSLWIEGLIRQYTKGKGIKFKSELFDW